MPPLDVYGLYVFLYWRVPFVYQDHSDMFLFLIRCDADLLLATLCTRTIQTHEGSIVITLDSTAALAGRDALAKTIYARLFDWCAFS